jgi:hypothetical protein
MCKMRLLRALIGSRHATASPAAVHSELFTGRVCLTRWDKACPTRNFDCRDKRAFCCVPLGAPLRIRSTCPARLPQTEASILPRTNFIIFILNCKHFRSAYHSLRIFWIYAIARRRPSHS